MTIETGTAGTICPAAHPMVEAPEMRRVPKEIRK